MSRLGYSILALLTVCGLAAPAPADQITLGQIEIAWGDEGQIWTSTPKTIGTISELADGSIHVEGSWKTADWYADWIIELGGATGITSNFSITSNVDHKEIFGTTVFVFSDVDIPAPTLAQGSVSVNVSDNILVGEPGASLAAVKGESVYDALIADVSVGTLLDFPYLLEADPFQSNSDGPFLFSNANGPAVAIGDTIAISHQFSLSAFDIGQVTGTLLITPEPASLGLLMIGGLAVLRRRIRR